MCGITGFISKSRRFAVTQLTDMRDTLVSRGPDDAELVAWDDLCAGIWVESLPLKWVPLFARFPDGTPCAYLLNFVAVILFRMN